MTQNDIVINDYVNKQLRLLEYQGVKNIGEIEDALRRFYKFLLVETEKENQFGQFYLINSNGTTNPKICHLKKEDAEKEAKRLTKQMGGITKICKVIGYELDNGEQLLPF